MPDRGQRIVSKGKVTLQQAVDILAKHKETEGDFGAEEIVKQYGTNSAATTGMLQHFFIFGMFETNTRKHESVTPDPLISQADWVDKGRMSKSCLIVIFNTIVTGEERSRERSVQITQGASGCRTGSA